MTELDSQITSPISGQISSRIAAASSDSHGGEAHSTEQESAAAVRSLADRLGIFLSALCVVHCLLTPFVLILIPSLQVSRYHGAFHEGLLYILPVLAVAAFIPGYRRHRDPRVFYWSLPGLLLICVGALCFDDHAIGQVVASVAGSLLLIRSHLINRQLCACCDAGDTASLKHAPERR